MYLYTVFCGGGSNAPPVLYSPYSTLFGSHDQYSTLGELHGQYRTVGESHDQYRTLLESHDEYCTLFEHFESHDEHSESHDEHSYRTLLRIYWDDTFSCFCQCIRLGWRRKVAAFTLFHWLLSISGNLLLFA